MSREHAPEVIPGKTQCAVCGGFLVWVSSTGTTPGWTHLPGRALADTPTATDDYRTDGS